MKYKYALFLNPEDFLYAEAVDRVLADHGDSIEGVYLFPSKSPFRKKMAHLLANLRILRVQEIPALIGFILGRLGRSPTLKSVALRHGKPIFWFKDVNSPEVEERIRSRGVDVVLNICMQIYRKEAISRLPPIYNFHGGYVPGNAGRFPVFWAYLKELPQVVTCHRITEVIDGGVPVLHYRLDSPRTESVWETTLKIRDRFPEIIERAIHLIDDGASETFELSIPRFYGPPPSRSDVARYRELLRRARAESRARD